MSDTLVCNHCGAVYKMQSLGYGPDEWIEIAGPSIDAIIPEETDKLDGISEEKLDKIADKVYEKIKDDIKIAK